MARRRRAAAVFAAGALLAVACSGGGDSGASAAAPASPTPAPIVTPPAELAVSRGGGAACYLRQLPAADVPAGVKGYRLFDTGGLPPGVVPVVRTVKFQSGGSNRVLEAEICFTADGRSPEGRHTAKLELRLYGVDSERLAVDERVTPVRALPFTQVIAIQ